MSAKKLGMCPQCGQDYSKRACGPTHAVIANRRKTGSRKPIFEPRKRVPRRAALRQPGTPAATCPKCGSPSKLERSVDKRIDVCTHKWHAGTPAEEKKP
jgi:hypothetical protein